GRSPPASRSAAAGASPAGFRRRSRPRLRRNRCGPRYGSGKGVRQWRGRRGSGESSAAGPERPLARALRPLASMAQNARPEAIAACRTPLSAGAPSLSISLADARFLFDRATGLIRRSWLSLRTRGLRASWQRVRAQLRRVPAAQRAALYFPADAPRVPAALATGNAPLASVVIPVHGQ